MIVRQALFEGSIHPGREDDFRAYVETARSKLRAANTTQAVARAIAAGIVLL